MVQNSDKIKESVFQSEELIFNAPVESRMMGEAASDEVEGASRESFTDLSTSQKRFHILFYVTASLTGIVIIQFIWQLAMYFAK